MLWCPNVTTQLSRSVAQALLVLCQCTKLKAEGVPALVPVAPALRAGSELLGPGPPLGIHFSVTRFLGGELTPISPIRHPQMQKVSVHRTLPNLTTLRKRKWLEDPIAVSRPLHLARQAYPQEQLRFRGQAVNDICELQDVLTI